MIEQRNGRFRVRIRISNQPQISRTFATRPAAEKWHAEIEDAIKLGTLADVLAAEVTFRQVLRDYAETVADRRGAVQEQRRIHQLEMSPLADLKLSAISRKVLRDHRDRRRDKDGIAGSTWNRELSLISMVLKYAVAEHDAKVNVRELTGGMRGKESTGRKGRISREDEQKLITAAAKQAAWVAPMIKLSLALGTRRGELFELRHADVDRQDLSLHVRGTKTEGSDRTIPISPATLAVIDSLPRSLTDDRLFWQARNPDMLTNAWRQAAKVAGVSAVMHLARHENLSRLAEAGATIPMLAAMSGHKTWAMLARYTRGKAEPLRALVAA